MKQEEVTVQIKVQEYDNTYYKYYSSISGCKVIAKCDCAIIPNAVKVKLKSELPLVTEDAWYFNLPKNTGRYYEVEEDDENKSCWKLVSQPLWIAKSDCTVVVPPVEETEGEAKVGDIVCSDTPNCYKEHLSGLCGKLLEVAKTGCDRYMVEVDMRKHPQYNGSQVNEFGFAYVLCKTVYKPLLHEIPTPEPKLIAKAGEWVKPTYFDKCSIMTNNNGCGFVLNEPVLLHQDLYSDSKKIYIESRYGIQHNESDLGATKFELCPAPRTPIRVYEGVEIFEDTKAWWICLRELKIMPCGSEMLFNWGENPMATKAYLTPEESNARLKEEVEKKSKVIKFTFEDLCQFEVYSDENPFVSAKVFAIELVEKEYSVIYLTPNTESK